MPRYIGYEPIGTANTSVTRLAAGPSITSLLLTLNGSNGATSTVDEAGSHTITFNGNAQLSTGQKKFGTASLLLDGSGDYLDVSQDSKFNLTGDFTIECWIRTSSTAGDGVIVDLNRLSISNPAGFVFYRNGSNITWYASSDGSTNNIANGLSFGTLSVDTWYHIAVAKKGSSWAAWLNGTRGSTLTSASTPYYNVSALTKIGAYVGGAEFEGYIDDVRIINGLAIYDPASASITVPAAELGIVISNSTIVDRKYNSGIWSLSDSYDRRVENIWPISNRGATLATVTIKSWAAGGGGANWNTASSPAADGGSGAYVTAEFIIPLGTTLAIRVPNGGIAPGDGNVELNYGDSNFRGGGASDGSGWGGGQGGGYAGVFIGTRTFANALVVSGGGGGGGAGSTSTQGGGGGGPNGEDGQVVGDGGGRGATQATGGAAGGGSAIAGSALTGGNGDPNTLRGSGGGGAGYYGGGGGKAEFSTASSASGGGGSSFYAATGTINGVGITRNSGSYSATTDRSAPNSGDGDYIAGRAVGGIGKLNNVTGGSGGNGLIVITVNGVKTTYSTVGNFSLVI
jgi:hypothetical protein